MLEANGGFVRETQYRHFKHFLVSLTCRPFPVCTQTHANAWRNLAHSSPDYIQSLSSPPPAQKGRCLWVPLLCQRPLFPARSGSPRPRRSSNRRWQRGRIRRGEALQVPFSVSSTPPLTRSMTYTATKESSFQSTH